MKVKIERVGNGYILEYHEDDDTVERAVFEFRSPEVYTEDETDIEVETFKDMLWTLNEVLGPSTSRYSKKRISIDVIKGDKCEDGMDADVNGLMKDINDDTESLKVS